MRLEKCCEIITVSGTTITKNPIIRWQKNFYSKRDKGQGVFDVFSHRRHVEVQRKINSILYIACRVRFPSEYSCNGSGGNCCILASDLSVPRPRISPECVRQLFPATCRFPMRLWILFQTRWQEWQELSKPGINLQYLSKKQTQRWFLQGFRTYDFLGNSNTRSRYVKVNLARFSYTRSLSHSRIWTFQFEFRA